MAIHKSKPMNFESDEFNVFRDNDLVLNPLNLRQWGDYEVFYSQSKGYHAATDGATALLKSMLYPVYDEAGDIKSYEIRVKDPIRVASKAVSAMVGETGYVEKGYVEKGYVVINGNSRLVLIDNLYKVYHSGLVTPVVTLKPFDINIDSSADVSAFTIEQIRANTSVAMSAAQKWALIVGTFADNLAAIGNVKGSMTRATELTAEQYGVSNQVVAVARRFDSYEQWFKDLVNSPFIQNAEILDKIVQLQKTAEKSGLDITLKELWWNLEEMAAESRTWVSSRILKAWETANIIAQSENNEKGVNDDEGLETENSDNPELEETVNLAEMSDQEIQEYAIELLNSLEFEVSAELTSFALLPPAVYNIQSCAYTGKRLLKVVKLLISAIALNDRINEVMTDSEIKNEKELQAAEANAKTPSISV